MVKCLTYFLTLMVGSYLAFSFELKKSDDKKCEYKFGDGKYWQKLSSVWYNNTIRYPGGMIWVQSLDRNLNKKVLPYGHMIYYICVNITNLTHAERKVTTVSYNPVFFNLHIDFHKDIPKERNVSIHVLAKEKRIFHGSKVSP